MFTVQKSNDPRYHHRGSGSAQSLHGAPQEKPFNAVDPAQHQACQSEAAKAEQGQRTASQGISQGTKQQHAGTVSGEKNTERLLHRSDMCSHIIGHGRHGRKVHIHRQRRGGNHGGEQDNQPGRKGFFSHRESSEGRTSYPVRPSLTTWRNNSIWTKISINGLVDQKKTGKLIGGQWSGE